MAKFGRKLKKYIGPALNFAQFIPGPQQPFVAGGAQAYNALRPQSGGIRNNLLSLFGGGRQVFDEQIPGMPTPFSFMGPGGKMVSAAVPPHGGGGFLNNLLSVFGGGKNNLLSLFGEDGGDLLSLLPAAFLSKKNPSQDIYNIQKGAYESGAPSRARALQLGTENFGRTDFSSQIPELLRTARMQTANRLANPFKSAYNPDALARLRESSLSEFDKEFQRQQAAENEKLNLLGLGSSGPGFEQRRLTGESGARSRALLGSQFDVSNLERQRQAQLDEEEARANELGRATGLGTQEFDINQLLGYEQPLNLLKYGSEVPSFNVPEQDQTNALLAYLLTGAFSGGGFGGKRKNNLLNLFGYA